MGTCTQKCQQAVPVSKSGKRKMKRRFRRKLQDGQEILEETFCSTQMDEEAEVGAVESHFEYAQVRKKAPQFSGESLVEGKSRPFHLKDYLNKWVLLVFYPSKSDVTPSEVKTLEDRYRDFQKANCAVVFIAADQPEAAGTWFQKKQEAQLGKGDIPFITDTKHGICKRYGVWNPNENAAFRSNFIIDNEGILRHANINDEMVGRKVEHIYQLLLEIQKCKDDDPYGFLKFKVVKITVYDMLKSKHDQGIDIWELGDEENQKYWKLIIEEQKEVMAAKEFNEMDDEAKTKMAEKLFWEYVEQITGRKREKEESPGWVFGAYEDEKALEEELKAKGELQEESEYEEYEEEEEP